MAIRVYDDEEIAARLKDLPRWSHVDGAIRREFKTASFKATLMLVTTVGHLCESAWHHPEMVVGFDTLVVKLSTHKPKGITDRDFALAERIDQVVGWRPLVGGALTGPPDDPRHAYLKDEGSTLAVGQRNPLDECEMRDGVGWRSIDIEDALLMHGQDIRCPACHGRVRAHRKYSDGARAHFEHQRAHSGCPLKPGFSGTMSEHPEALT